MSTTTRRKKTIYRQSSHALPPDTWLSVLTSGSGGAMIGAFLGPIGSVLGGVLGAAGAVYASRAKQNN